MRIMFMVKFENENINNFINNNLNIYNMNNNIFQTNNDNDNDVKKSKIIQH